VVLKLKTVSDGKDKGVDSVTNHVWRMMKYTQGENDQKVNIKFHLPVVVQADSSATGDETKAEVKIMVTLPIEYQEYYAEGGDSKIEGPKEAPKPDDEEIQIEVIEEFIGISRYSNQLCKIMYNFYIIFLQHVSTCFNIIYCWLSNHII
jgi:hypothetical protein